MAGFSYHSIPYPSITETALEPEIWVTSKRRQSTAWNTSQPPSVGGQRRCHTETLILLQFMALTSSRMWNWSPNKSWLTAVSLREKKMGIPWQTLPLNTAFHGHGIKFYAIGHVKINTAHKVLQCFPWCFYRLFAQIWSSHKISHL